MSIPKPAKIALKAAVTTILLASVIFFAGPARVWSCLRQADFSVLLLASVLTFPLLGIKILKWHILVRHLGPEMTFSRSLSSYMRGLVLAIVTPFASGELARGMLLSREHAAAATGRVMLDKLIDLIWVCLLSALGLAYLAEGVVSVISLAAGILLFVAGALLFATPWPGTMLRRLDRFPLATTASKVVESIQRTRKRDLIQVSLLALGFYVVLYLQAYALLWSFLGEAPPTRSIAAYPFITLSTILPVAIGGVGIREGTAVLMLHGFGIPAAVAFNAFFAHWIVLLVIPALIFLPFAARSV